MISDMNNSNLGKTVAHYRKLRGLTQVEFGKLLSRSTSWVKKFEAGERQANPQIGIVEHISQVLGITPEDLLKNRGESQKPLLRRNTSKDEMIHNYIDKIERIILTPATYLDKEPNSSFKKVHQEIDHAYAISEKSHYLTVSSLLPDLLIELYSLPKQRKYLHLVAFLYRLVCVTLIRLGAIKLGVIAAEQALSAALEYNDPHEIALSTWAMVYALSLDDKASFALEIGEKTLSRISHFLDRAGAPGSAALGFLLMRCSFASSVLGDQQEAMKFLDKSKPYGDRVGKTNYFYTNFGHANIKLHEFLVYSNLGMHGKAFEYEAFINTSQFTELTKERKTHFLVDLAHLHWKEANYEKSALLLMHTFRISEQELKAREEARDLLHSLRHDISRSHFSSQTVKFLEDTFM